MDRKCKAGGSLEKRKWIMKKSEDTGKGEIDVERAVMAEALN